MPIIDINKTVIPNQIWYYESTNVMLSLTGEPDISETPTDIILALDVSGSMSGQRIIDLKNAANQFVDIMDEATDGVLNGIIGGGSRIGVVPYQTTAYVAVPLTSDADAIKTAIDGLTAGGSTNHADAFIKAQAELDSSNPQSNKIIIIFTNGTSGSAAADAAAAAARAAGTIIYGVGLGTASETNLNKWCTPPPEDHVFIAPTSEDLEKLFEEIGAIISQPAATNIVITDTINNDFFISNVIASKGTAQTNDNVITWTVDSLGSISRETITLTFTATHNPQKDGGLKLVNTLIEYQDDEGNQVEFPNPPVNVLWPLNITKSDSPDPVKLGEDIVYTISIKNIANVDIENVTLTDFLPKEVNLKSVVLSQGSYTQLDSEIICDIGTMATGATADIVITVTAAATGCICNRAVASYGNSHPDLFHTITSCTTIFQTTCLEVKKIYDVISQEEEIEKCFKFCYCKWDMKDVCCSVEKIMWKVINLSDSNTQGYVDAELEFEVIVCINLNDHLYRKIICFKKIVTICYPDNAKLDCEFENISCECSKLNNDISCSIHFTVIIKSYAIQQFEIPYLGTCEGDCNN